MVRLMVYCEGETEEAFINEVLVPVLSDHGIYTSAHSCGCSLDVTHTKR